MYLPDRIWLMEAKTRNYSYINMYLPDLIWLMEVKTRNYSYINMYLPDLIWLMEAKTRNIKAAGTVMVSLVSSNITSFLPITYRTLNIRIYHCY